MLANRLACMSSTPELPVTKPPVSRLRAESKRAPTLETVNTLCGRAAEAGAEQIKLLEPRLHLLIRDGEFERCPLDEIAPAAAVDPEPAEPGIRCFDSLLVFHRFHQVAARHGSIPLRNLRYALRTTWNRLRRARHCSR